MDQRPNFLLIVADDLGFSDCGCFGSEIQTPNIDALAGETNATRFTSFHVAAACSPTRSMLMTGIDHHIAGFGQLAEVIRNSPAHQGQPGHEGYLNDKVVAVPELLQQNGYWTAMSGKWHLGLKKEQSPHARGFTKSFALLPGCANHYGWEPAYKDKINEPPAFFETAVTALHMEDTEYVDELPKDFYSSDFYVTKLISQLESRTEQEKQQPFFAYLPFSAPHWPLQAPEESIRKYRGFYDQGPSALRLQRLQKLQDMGLIAKDVVPHEAVTVPGEPSEWDEMSDDVKAKSARSMEVYAGMVDRMDENVGRVVQYLKEIGTYDNTLIMFMSDNGAEGASYEAMPLRSSEITQHLEQYYDNSLENLGRKNSFIWYGTRWAQAGTAPSRLYKMYATEGGCRVPLVCKPPGVMSSELKDSGVGGTVSDAFATVLDIVPTILDMSGTAYPSSWKGQEVSPLTGRSWRTMLRNLAALPDVEGPVGFECNGSGGLRRGKYKITYVPAPKGPEKWELFDIVADPGETKDLAQKLPEIFENLLTDWEAYAKRVGVVGLAGDLKKKNYKMPVDEFQDIGKWTRWIGKKDVPEEIRQFVPA